MGLLPILTPSGLVCTQTNVSGLTKLGSMTAGGGLAAGFNGTTTEGYDAGAKSGATSGTMGFDLGSGITKILCRYDVYIIAGLKIDGGAGTTTITEIDAHASTDNFSSSNVTIHSPANQTNDSNNQLFSFTVTDQSTAYRYWRFDFTHNGGAETHVAEVIPWFLE